MAPCRETYTATRSWMARWLRLLRAVWMLTEEFHADQDSPFGRAEVLDETVADTLRESVPARKGRGD